MNDTAEAQTFQTMKLDIPHFARNVLHVIRLEGEEGISRPYAFHVHFTCPDVLDGAGAVGKPVTLTINLAGESFIAAGVIVEFRSDDPTPLGDYAYHVQIGPRFSLLELSRQNQVYGTLKPIKIADIIEGKLSHSFSRSSTSGGETTQVDYELRLSGVYPVRYNVVQFDESDLNFIARSCEHFGVFYFFEHAHLKDTIVFGDANVAFNSSAILKSLPPILEEGPLAKRRRTESVGDGMPFRMTRGLASDVSVSSFLATSRPVPQKMYLRDFDDTQAGAQLLASALVDRNGIGAVVEYGQNFTSVDEGDRLAGVRAEEKNSQKTVFHGVSSAASLRPGYFFTLADHPNQAMNGKYVVIAARHRAADPRMPDGPYENRFQCIRFDVPYRPQRLTPRPVAAGLFNATIDSSGLGERADIDDVGRYKVRHIYDESNSPPGHASAYVRKAQPYAGKGDTGFHFPLLKDAEVVVGYINGDPDRPIILGAVPNSLTPAVSVQDNKTTNRFRSPSGGLFELHDGRHHGGVEDKNGTIEDRDSPYVRLVSQSAGKTEYSDSSYIRLGGYVSNDEAALEPTGVKVTSSTVNVETWDSSADYLTASLLSSTKKGQLTSAQQQGTTATQSLQKAAVTPSARTALNNGIFMYSDQDFQLNAKGAAYMEFQSGHSTLLTSGDSAYNVSNGQFTVSAKNGISLTAGVAATQAVTAVTAVAGVAATAAQIAAGNVHDNAGQLVTSDHPYITQPVSAVAAKPAASGAPADLYLISANNINQKAYGPLSEITYGDSYKNVQGNTTDIFNGTYYKETHGTLTQHLYADTYNTNHQNVTSTTIGNTASAFLGATQSVFTGAAFSFKLDIELNIVLGIKIDLTLGGAVKLVAGIDLGILTTSFKITIIDVKVAQTDFKIVTVDSKNFAVEIKNGGITADQLAIINKSKGLESQLVGLRVISAASVAKLRPVDVTI